MCISLCVINISLRNTFKSKEKTETGCYVENTPGQAGQGMKRRDQKATAIVHVRDSKCLKPGGEMQSEGKTDKMSWQVRYEV